MRILVVDNDPQVHAVTVLVAKGKTMTLVNDPFSPFSCVWNEYGKCDEPTETSLVLMQSQLIWTVWQQVC